jgi:hypothetical protein
MNMKKDNVFNSQHFKITMRPPKWKDLDIEDERDVSDAKLKLYKELTILLRDEVFPSLNIIPAGSVTEVVPKRLPQKVEDEMTPEMLRKLKENREKDL